MPDTSWPPPIAHRLRSATAELHGVSQVMPDEEGGLYIGLMSGTSADGIDAALVGFVDERPQLLHALTLPWREDLRAQLLDLGQASGPIELDTLGHLDVAIGEAFAEAANRLRSEGRVPLQQLAAVGSHGQTVRHRPGGEHPFSMQLGDPSVIAERCGVTVVAHFRQADVAAGGQGAPLLPAMHAMLLDAGDRGRAVLNLGGIANLTYLDGQGGVSGFDTGPANALLDLWCRRLGGEPFDRDGAFAAQGRVVENLLDALLADPYFARPPPKSTGREHFNAAWLDGGLGAFNVHAADVQATLLELTARSVRDAVLRHAPGAADVLVCGGGVHNALLMQRIAALLAPRPVRSTAEFGVDPDYLEAIAFAWLARERLLGRSASLPAVTGARGPRLLGAIYGAPPPV